MSEECLPIQELDATPSRFTVIDVRDAEEYAAGHVYGALNVPLARLEEKALLETDARRIVTVCGKGGGRSAEAVQRLHEFGFSDAIWLCGGTNAWLERHGAD